jgi:hypothetical protein
VDLDQRLELVIIDVIYHAHGSAQPRHRVLEPGCRLTRRPLWYGLSVEGAAVLHSFARLDCLRRQQRCAGVGR